MRIGCVCVNDQDKPNAIPSDKWVVKNKPYTITWIYKQINQKGIQGVTLAEHDISMYAPYNCYRLDRFAIHKDDIDSLIELMKLCTEMSDVDIKELVEELETVEV